MDQAEKSIIDIVKQVIAEDDKLREKHHIGEKFRFIRERLCALQTSLEQTIAAIVEKQKQAETRPEVANEVLVYVHLYNVQGALLSTWTNLLNPKLFYEYSVNRPIYADLSHIESWVRSKPNRAQHAYLTVAVDANQILPAIAGAPAKDMLGNTLVKVKEGALHFKHLISFTHNGQSYKVGERGEMVKLSS